MKVLLTGANGQLARDIQRIFAEYAEFEVTAFDRDQLDVTKLDAFQRAVQSERPDIILFSSAYTAVDKAEQEIDQAYAVNAYGARNAAVAANEVGAGVCYISTDYVFDGTSQQPYCEYDNTNPIGIYGQSKSAGEKLIQSIANRYFIVRTSWLFGVYGNNFVKTMLRLARERSALKVVHDQIGSPTYTVDLARFITDLIQTEQYGIYHASNTGACSWYEFAMAIFDQAGLKIDVQPCTTSEFPRPAPRPQFSVLDHMSIRVNGFKDLRPWQEGLSAFLEELGERPRHS